MKKSAFKTRSFCVFGFIDDLYISLLPYWIPGRRNLLILKACRCPAQITDRVTAGEIRFHTVFLCQFPQDLGAIFLQHGLWHLQQRHVDRLCCTSIDAAGKIVIHSCVIASRCFGIHALLLPELQLYWEVRNTHLRKGIIRQQDLTKKPELCLHLPNH